LIAGICLFIPGFITDTIGALLLLPFIRLMLGRAGLAHMVVRTRAQKQGGPFSNTPTDETSDNLGGGMIIDGEFQETGTQENSTKDINDPSETEQTNARDKEI
ncbi:MAG: FxsA family protein, partial [Kordiimonadaceae bacterium]|nr:FxsA family protein [Kordiimonadaceae bacterium]